MAEPRPPVPETSGPAHERVYRVLRNRIMWGEMAPGQPLTLRGVAEELGVSMTPSREAVRRLAAEGALSLSSSGRISTPELSNDRLEELASIRALLEPELASRALPRAHMALIDRLDTINHTIDQMIVKNDATGYVRSNLEFHRTLYLRAQAPAMLALTESVWLQVGPTMRRLYAQRQRSDASANHLKILAALRAGDDPGLRLAVRADVTRGLRMLAT
ncbi:GntR family transcriptional regulator [Paroceanicella profunda]|uniref:GntR family transcriptional regulator n=1 Tax=Paroceanicella profunda TaxID=2579971 RepID=A0A5B8FV08_9RHOB|nr:GntR family transcriptional regulator [Paroceanicella profunda]QDL90900.1 GntR family transcriptional regulator [Paroceanicella profunda]